MKTQWQKEIEKMHQIELAKLAAISDLQRLDIDIRQKNVWAATIATLAVVAFLVVAAFI